MSIRSLANTSCDELARAAADVMSQQGELVVYINRSRSEIVLPKRGPRTISIITPQLRDRLISKIIPKQEGLGRAVFYDLQGNQCYVEPKVLNQCFRIVRKIHPGITIHQRVENAVVDKKTNIELMPEDTQIEYGWGYDDPRLSFECPFEIKPYRYIHSLAITSKDTQNAFV